VVAYGTCLMECVAAPTIASCWGSTLDAVAAQHEDHGTQQESMCTGVTAAARGACPVPHSPCLCAYSASTSQEPVLKCTKSIIV
jgi:hypothetical protein